MTNIYWTTALTLVDNLMPYECVVPGNLEQAVSWYKEIKKSDPGNRMIREDRLNTIGYNYLNTKKYTEAINIFKIITEIYPESWNAFDSLGEAYMKVGNNELAIENYEKSIKLNPDSKSGAEALMHLKENK